MVLFVDVWSVGTYRYAAILLWIVSIIGIVWGFLLIVDYINARKRHYLLWGASFSLIWIGFHQVITTGTYSTLLNGLMAAMLAFIPGLLAAGLLMAVYSDKIYGKIYALFSLIMAIVIAVLKFDPFNWVTGTNALLPSVMVILLHVPSGFLLFLVPILTTFKTKETRWPALFMSVGGVLFGVGGFLLSLAVTGVFVDEPTLLIIVGLLPIAVLFACIAFALGTIIPAKWNFNVPGVEFEERA